MPLPRFILILSLFVSTQINGQQSFNLNKLAGTTFVSKTLEYLKVLNDTTLYSSINSYTDTATFFLKDDTLFIKQRYLQTDQTGTKWMNRLYDYKVLALSSDTVRLKNNYRFDYKPDNWEDTLTFVNLEKLEEPTTNFKFLKLEYLSPWSGTRQIIIDSLGKVKFTDRPLPYDVHNPRSVNNAKPKSIKGRFSQKEFINFKNLLSRSLPSKLPAERDCPIDGATSNFEIVIGKQNIKSNGCDLSWTHTFLLNYLYNIDQNKGFIKEK
jgi:hypothetical protein